MKIRTGFAAMLLCAVLLVLTGCFESAPSEPTEAAFFSAPIDPAQIYADAAAPIIDAADISYSVTAKKVTQAGTQIFTEHSAQILSFQNWGSDDMLGSMDETLTIGTHKVAIQEVYSGGIAYFTVNGSGFTAPMTSDEYAARYVPVSILDVSLYKSIEASTIGERTLIGFSQPVDAENWAMPDGAHFQDAAALAVISSDGTLVEVTYSIEYTYGTAAVTLSTTVIPHTSATPAIEAPADTSGYVSLEHPDAPRLVEQACGYLLQANDITASATERINCQAFAITRTQTTELIISGKVPSLTAQLDTAVNQVNHSRGGESTDVQQTELFRGGVYTVSTNGNAPEPKDTVSSETMLAYCQDILVGSVILPEHITATALEETDTAYRLTFTASEALAEAICARVCQTLYNDPSLLNSLASSYTTDTMECYLEIDKYTGIPTASGLNYSGTHTIEGSTYQLSSQIDQTYQFSK